MDNQDVCLRLDISPRTLQTLRDTGRLAFTQIQRKIYYRPEDVEKLMAYVAMKRKEKAVREKRTSRRSWKGLRRITAPCLTASVFSLTRSCRTC